ncbi:tRNA1(Val) (adenine(37)-N6)-methyltransferase [Dorea sp. OM02-2LB]|nr:tRNA1(Val) (adenine(37)-N6)-methyltransferase [Dorea sp. OM02-2LB]RGV95095.1 tRNA1(Val) (adenine(37)-N6)-methyltransferase [Ruminococcus sp. AF14-10]
MAIKLHSGERLDDLQLNGLQIIQDPKRFCFGMDAVLLSDFAKVRIGEKVLDLGTGTGILPILFAGKTKGQHFTGLEIQPESAEMARRSVAYNHLEEKIEIVTGDIKEAGRLFQPAFFDVITVNPPYMADQCGIQNPQDAKAIARHEILCNLEDIFRESKKLLPEGKGRFYMVHRPVRLAEILLKMSQSHIEPKRIQLVHPYVDKEPVMVLIEGRSGARPGVRIEPPLILHEHGK